MNIGAGKIMGAFLKLPLCELKLDALFWNHDCVIKAQLFWTNLPMKLGCMNVVEDFKRNIRMKLGSLRGLILAQN